MRILLTIVRIILIFAMALMLFSLLFKRAKADNVDQQIVLQVANTGTTDKFVISKATVVLRLVPISGETAKAPLNNGDMMICRVYDFQDENHIQHAGFKCGSDIYVVAGIRYDQKK